MTAIPGVWAGALGDLFGKPLRGLLLICAALAGALLAAATWGATTVLVPLIPQGGAGWTGWLSDIGRALAEAGVVLLAILLFPAVSMIVGGALFDAAAQRVERLRFPSDAPARAVPLHEGLLAGLRIAPLALLLNVLALPLVFIPVVNVLAFTLLNAFLMGRECFTLAALRFRTFEAARDMRRRRGVSVYLAALAPALLAGLPTMLPITPFLIPLVAIVSFPAPLLGAAVMVRLHKALSAASAA